MNEIIQRLIDEEKQRQAEAERAEAERQERIEAERAERIRIEWRDVRVAICAALPDELEAYIAEPDPKHIPGYQACLELVIEDLAPIEAWAQRSKDSCYRFEVFHVKDAAVHQKNGQLSMQWKPNRSLNYSNIGAALVEAERQHRRFTAEVEAAMLHNEETERQAKEWQGKLDSAEKQLTKEKDEVPAPYIATAREIALLEAMRQFVGEELSNY